MNILFRTTTDLLINGMSARLTVYRDRNDILTVEIIPYNSSLSTEYTDGAAISITYNGETIHLSSNPFTTAMSAVFNYIDNVKSIAISSNSEIVYKSAASYSHTISWRGSGTLTPPTVSVSSYSGLIIDETLKLNWSISGVPDNCVAYTIGVWYYYSPNPITAADTSYTRYTAFDGEKSSDTSYEHSIETLDISHTLYYKVAVAVYENESDAADDYIAYAELVTPWYTCSGDYLYPLSPVNIKCTNPQLGSPFLVSCELIQSTESVSGVKFQRALDGSNEWEDVYTGSSTSITDKVTGFHTSVRYRAATRASKGVIRYSLYAYGAETDFITTNIYVGVNNSPALASGVWIGSHHASATAAVG